jgi:hypothetical protein
MCEQEYGFRPVALLPFPTGRSRSGGANPESLRSGPFPKEPGATLTPSMMMPQGELRRPGKSTGIRRARPMAKKEPRCERGSNHCRTDGARDLFNNRRPGMGKEVFGKEQICITIVCISYLVIRHSPAPGSLLPQRFSHFFHIQCEWLLRTRIVTQYEWRSSVVRG